MDLVKNWIGVLQAQLELIMSTNGLSENVFEIASKSLAA
jgi:aminopeptidase N